MVSKGRIAALALILLLIPAYVVVVSAVPMTISSTCNQQQGGDVQATDQVGFCTKIGFSVTRSYYFDTLRLPVTTGGVNVDLLNRTFLPFLLLAAVAVWRY